jgi:hypothetical protein
MFRRILTLLLPLLSLVCGCMGLRRDREAVEYRPGTPPTTVVAERDATYRLCADEPDPGRPWVDVTKGERVGFRRESDGSLVAIAGTRTTPVPDVRHVWISSSWPVTRWERFAESTVEGSKKVAGIVVAIPMLPFVFLWCVTGHELP